MPRPSNREHLLQTGQEILHRGFAATGVQQITTAGGVPKGSFYSYFPSKEQFGIEVMRRYVLEHGRAIEAILVDGEGTPLQRLATLFDRLIEREREGGFARGCLAGNLAQELAGVDPAFREELELALRQLQRHFTELLFEAQQAGELDAAEDPDELAAFVYNAWQGALLRMKAAGSDRPLHQFRTVVFGRLLAPPA